MAWKMRRNQQGFAQEFVSTDESPWASDLPSEAGGAQMYEEDAEVVRMASWPNPDDQWDPKRVGQFRPSAWHMTTHGHLYQNPDELLEEKQT